MSKKGNKLIKTIVIIAVITWGGMLFTSCNKETCPAYSLQKEDNKTRLNAFGSRDIQSPLTDQGI